MIKKIKNASRKEKIILSLIIVVVLISILEGVKLYKSRVDVSNSSEKALESLEVPSISLVSNNTININSKDEFDIAVILSSLPPNIYPAASISINFDKEKLEFTGVKKGTMQIYGDKQLSGEDFNVPMWEFDKEVANTSGQINVMYIDKTAGRFAYNKYGFDNKLKNVVLSLKFKLKDGIKQGDKIPLDIDDAVFATINGDEDSTNLSSLDNTLNINGCELLVKE